MDWVRTQRIVIMLIIIVCAYFIANAVTVMLLTALHVSGPAVVVAGLVVFAVLFFAILQGIEKLTGIGIFRFDGH